MSTGVTEATIPLDAKESAWLKKIGVMLNVDLADGATVGGVSVEPDGAGLPGKDVVGGGHGNAAPDLLGSPLQDRVAAKSEVQIEDNETNWSIYRTNVQSMAGRIKKVREDNTQDPKVAAAKRTVMDTYDKMTTAEVQRRIKEAWQLHDQLPDDLDEYDRVRAAYEKAQKEAAEQQQKRFDDRDALQQKLDALEYLINDAINHPPEHGPELGDFGIQIEKLKQAYDSARMIDDLPAAKTNLDTLERELQSKLAAVRAAFDKSLKELETAAQQSPYLYEVEETRKNATAIKKNSRATISEYVAANKRIEQVKRTLEEAKKKAAERAKDEPKRQEAAKQAQVKLDAELKALKAELDRFVDDPYPPFVSADPKWQKIFEELQKWKKDWDDTLKQGYPFPTGKYGSGWPTQGPPEIRQLFKDYVAAGTAFWKGRYEIAEAKTKAQLEPVLNAKDWTDDAMKVERDKVLALKKELDEALAKKDYYKATVSQSKLGQQLHQFNSLILKVPSPPGPYKDKFQTFKPRVLGKPVQGPAASTMLMLQDETASGPTKDQAGIKLNTDGTALLVEWERLSKQQVAWESKLDIVEKNAGKGAEDLKQVDKVKDAIAAATRDPAGGYLRDAIGKYSKAVDDVEAKLGEVKVKILLVEAATKEIKEASLSKDKLEKERESNKKQGEVQAEEKKIQDLKSNATFLVGIGVSVISKLQWWRLAITVGVFVGEKIFEENIPTSNLEKLKKELEEIKADLAKIQDESVLVAIEKAALKFQAAKVEIENAEKALLAAVDQAQFEETTVVEAMKKSPTTTGAAKVIAKRGEVFAAAREAGDSMGKYLTESEPFPARIAALGKAYQDYTGPQNLAYGPYRDWIMATTKNNSDTLAQFKTYIDGRRERARKALEYLAKAKDGTYFAGYDQMHRVLRAAATDRNKKKPK